MKSKADNAPTFRVVVSFGSHVFTRSLQSEDPKDIECRVGRETQAFCLERYKLSLGLPEIVKAAANGRAYFSQNRNYLLIEQVPSLNGPYAIFFNAEVAVKAGADVAMFVVSAYEKPNLPKPNRLSRISFATLISKIALGQTVRRPKRK